MKIQITILSALILSSCSGSNIDKQIKEEREKEKEQVQQIVDKTEEIIKEKQRIEFERDSLLLSRKSDIITRINEFIPSKVQVSQVSFGGTKNGSVFIENKTGFDIQEITVTVDIVLAGDQHTWPDCRQQITFYNLKDKESQSKPVEDCQRGYRAKSFISSITSTGLTGGNEFLLK